METLYTHIENLCRDRGIRPGKMCTELGLSRSLMTDLKMGRKRSIHADTARKIANYLGITLEQLMDPAGVIAPEKKQEILLDDVDVAFYGQYKELSDDDKETVRDMVRLMRQRRAAKQRE